MIRHELKLFVSDKTDINDDKLRWLLGEATDEEREMILKLGLEIYDKTCDIKLEKYLDKIGNKKLELLQDEYKKDLEARDIEIKDLIKEYEEKEKMMRETYKIKKKSKYNDLEKTVDRLTIEKEELKQIIKDKEENIKNKDDKMMEILQMQNKMNISKNKGEFGEKTVEEYLKNEYNNINIRKVNKKSGDLIAEFPEDNCIILIEVKNQYENTNTHIEKFERDIIVNKDKINCGIYISLEDVNIPNKGDLYFSLLSGVPIIYMTNAKRYYDKTKIVIEMMRRINAMNKRSNNIDNGILIKKMNDYIKIMGDNISQLEKTIESLEKIDSIIFSEKARIMKSIHETREYYENGINYLEDNNIREIYNSKYSKLISKEDIKEYIKKNIENGDKVPLQSEICEYFNITTKYFYENCGKMRDIKKEINKEVNKIKKLEVNEEITDVKKLEVNEEITADFIKKTLEEIEENNKKTSKKELRPLLF